MLPIINPVRPKTNIGIIFKNCNGDPKIFSIVARFLILDASSQNERHALINLALAATPTKMSTELRLKHVVLNILGINYRKVEKIEMEVVDACLKPSPEEIFENELTDAVQNGKVLLTRTLLTFSCPPKFNLEFAVYAAATTHQAKTLRILLNCVSNKFKLCKLNLDFHFKRAIDDLTSWKSKGILESEECLDLLNGFLTEKTRNLSDAL